jgi:hypothetical protein
MAHRCMPSLVTCLLYLNSTAAQLQSAVPTASPTNLTPTYAPTEPPTPLQTVDLNPQRTTHENHKFITHVSMIGIAICASLLMILGTYRFVRMSCGGARTVTNEDAGLGESLYTIQHHTEDSGLEMNSLRPGGDAAEVAVLSTPFISTL